MKVDVTALRDFRHSDDGVNVRTVREGETVSVNLTRARSLRDAGKVRPFDDPKTAKGDKED